MDSLAKNAGSTTQISGRLLDWYDRHARALPWRTRAPNCPDPYHVWLSEIMLQQTTVKAVAPYYRNFISRWPTVNLLAAADEEDVMRAWAGLGYYARARNLHACAKAVVDKHGGIFPQTLDELQALPGIGRYTAGAIGSIAFGIRAAALDGNVERVVARLYAEKEPLPASKEKLRVYAEGLVPADRPGDFNQAMMDLGATICSPKTPACVLCPLRTDCLASAQGIAADLPYKAPKPERLVRYGLAFVAMDSSGRVLLRRRPPEGLLGGMTEVPTTVWTSARQNLNGHAPFEAKWKKLTGRVQHTFTHFHLELDVYAAQISRRPSVEGRWVAVDDLAGEALPSVMRKVLAHALNR
jgi:A/G-specific adenine glycosylase